MKKTKKALVAILSALFVICAALATVVACKNDEENATLSSIKISTPPDKIVYISGETFDYTGMVVTATYSDKTEKTLEYGGDKGWSYEDPGKLTVAAGKFSASMSIKVSYTEGEVTKTANQVVTVTNSITSATIKTQPTTTEYFIGGKFDPTGMQIEATLQDGTKTTVDVTKDNCTFKPDGALSSSDKEVVVTVGGFEVKVPIKVLNNIYVEAETGYRNGELIEQSTGESGNIRTDATTAKAKTGAENLFKAQLRADFALSQLKKSADYNAEVMAEPSDTVKVTVGGKTITKEYDAIVAWLNDAANKTAIEEYEKSEEFTKAVEDYLKSDKFVEDYSHYVAHAAAGEEENYLGQNNQGDILSFVFSSSAQTKGSIAFRLSSAYLYKDSSWLAIIMGDMQFNKLVEFYVNGVKADIADDVLLEGGMTADGSSDNVLWCNWKEVKFDNVQFVEGRNVVELRFLNHGIVGSQSGYKFAANVDTLLVAPAENSKAQLDTYDNSKVTVDFKTTSVKLDGTNFSIGGTLSNTSKGYFGDRIIVKVGSTNIGVTTSNGKFTGTGDLSNLKAGTYAITITDNALKKGSLNIDTTTKKVGNMTYTFVVAEDDTVSLVIEKDVNYAYKATLDADFASTKANSLKLVYGSNGVVTGGKKSSDEGISEGAIGSFDSTGLVTTYTFTLAADGKVDFVWLIAGSHWNGSGNGGIADLGQNLEVTIDGKDVNVSGIALPAGETSEWWNLFKFVIKDVDLTAGEHVFKAEVIASGGVNIDSMNIYSTSEFGEVAATPEYAMTNAELKVEGEKLLLVVSGTYKGYTAAEIEAFIVKANFQGNPYIITGTWTGDWSFKTFGDKVVKANADGTFTITIDVSVLAETEYAYTGHMSFGTGIEDMNESAEAGSGGPADLKLGVSIDQTVKFGDKNVQLISIPAGGSENYWGCLGIRVTDATAPVNELNTQMSLVKEGDKVYVVVTGKYANMTEAEVKAAYAFDAQVAAGANKNQTTQFTEEAGTVIWSFDKTSNTFTVKIDVTNLSADGGFWMHYAKGGDLTCTADESSAITLNGKTYVFRNVVFSWGNRDLLCVIEAE